jgi:RNA polymerase sigma factor (sigma-70 family)
MHRRVIEAHHGLELEQTPKAGSTMLFSCPGEPGSRASRISGCRQRIRSPERYTEDMRDGDDDFAGFYSTTKARVFQVVFMATSDRQRSEDAVSEAFVKAYQHWRRLSQHPNPIAWVVRTALNAYRSAGRIRRREWSGLPEREAAVTADLPDPDLWEALKLLSRGQREAIALRVLLDLTTRESAELLGVSEGTVKTQLHRGLGQLRERLSPSEQKEVLR